MKHHRFCAPGARTLRLYGALVGAALPLVSCGLNEPTNFQDDQQIFKVNLNVEKESAATTGEADAKANPVSKSEAAAILEGLYADDDSIVADSRGRSLEGSPQPGNPDVNDEAANGDDNQDAKASQTVYSDGDGEGPVNSGTSDPQHSEGGIEYTAAGNEELADDPYVYSGSGEPLPEPDEPGCSEGECGADDTGDDQCDGSDRDCDDYIDWNHDGPTSDLNKAELRACAKIHGIPAERIHIAGRYRQEAIKADSVVAIKLAGHRSHLDLTLMSTLTVRVDGICLFLTGNQSTAKVLVGLELGTLVYLGRGNQSHAEVVVDEGGSIDDVIADLGGNQASLTVRGDGRYPCPDVRTRGNKPVFTCH